LLNEMQQINALTQNTVKRPTEEYMTPADVLRLRRALGLGK